MKEAIQLFCRDRTKEFDQIPEDRKKVLLEIGEFIKSKDFKTNLLFICTHNSRRSTFGQVWAKTASAFFGFTDIQTFSGGTEVTAFNPNAIGALRKVGFDISIDKNKENPNVSVSFENGQAIDCYSKTFDDSANPTENFAALMTCGHADENCPYISGCDVRIPLTYVDPKISDGTAEQEETYYSRGSQIAREMLFLFKGLV